MQDRLGLFDFLTLLLVLALAAAARGGYLYVAADQGRGVPTWEVQGSPPRSPMLPVDAEMRGHKNPNELDNLVHSLHEDSQFASWAPLSVKQEPTAHVSPGYAWIFSQVGRLDVDADLAMRWLQAGLGVLTVLCYWFFARRAFGSRLVALLAGVLTALHPFWIINTAELNDGVMASFALAAVLMLGTRGSQEGGVLTSLLFGVLLAGLVMVRASLLPFAVVALIWFLLRCHRKNLGWLCALLAFLGFSNPLAPWIVRNVKEFGEPIPIVSSAFLHLWEGNNAKATGGDMDEATLRNSLPDERLKELLDEPNQVKRYNMLGHDLLHEIKEHPQEICGRRIRAGLAFVLGENWFKKNELGQKVKSDATAPPAWLDEWAETALEGSWLFMMLLGFLGWRWALGWRHQARLASMAVVWLPLPYLLSHAGNLSGPRLPLDGILLTFAALAVLGPRLSFPKIGPSEKKKK